MAKHKKKRIIQVEIVEEETPMKKICVPLVLGIFMLLVLLPPIMYGYDYPNNGDDTAHHLEYFDSIKEGNPLAAMYLGRWMVGYAIVWLSNISHLNVDILFLWFNFGVLCLMGIVAYLTVSKIFNWQAGLLAMPLILFVTPGTLNLFDNGAVFDLITVGILFPLFILCLACAIRARKHWLWLTVLLFPLLVCFHSAVLVGSVSVNAVVLEGVKSPVSQPLGVALSLIALMSRYVAIVGLVVILFILLNYSSVKLDKSQKVVLLLLAVTIVALGFLTIINFAGISMRFAIDLCIVLAFVIACLLGVMWQTTKSKVALVIVAVLIVITSVPVVKTYLGYNSAITPIDLEAIEYVNSLEGEYYSCSSEIAPWIYGRFINKTYKEDSPIYIYRNKPMTYKTIKGSPHFWGEPYNYKALTGHILYSFWDDNGLELVIWQGE